MISNIKIIVIFGGGSREVAIAKKLFNQNKISLYYCADKENYQMNEICKKKQIDNIEEENTVFKKEYSEAIKLLNSYYIPNDIKYIQNFINKISINYIVIGQEKYLEDKYISMFDKKNINIIGPKYNAAKLELSKSYARNVIKCINSDFNPKLNLFNKYVEIENIELVNRDKSFVIKPDGITGGKGVKIYPDHFNSFEEAINYIKVCKEGLVEERLEGQEFSLMCFTDSVTVKFMPPVQDFKRALEGDKGMNTGSMGSICDNVNGLYFLSDSDMKKCKDMVRNVINYMSYNEDYYKGILYSSFMKTSCGEIKIIEFNARFGDPEGINVLSLLETDLHTIFNAINYEELSKLDIEFKKNCNSVIYIVPKNYGLMEVNNDDDCIETDSLEDMSRKTLSCEKTIINKVSKNNKNNKICSYIGSMNMVELTDLIDFETSIYLEPTKSRSYALLFESQSLEECCVMMSSFFGEIYKLNDKLFRYRKDIISGYLDRMYKSKYTSIAGIDTNLVGNTLSESKKYIENTFTKNVVSSFGQFSGCYTIDDNIMKNCNRDNQLELMASTDGVGTKILLLEQLFGSKGYYIAGQDLVNHNINDILVDGGSPLFFLDYYGCNKLNPDNLKEFIRGCSDACVLNGISILGGETAIMKDIYKANTADLNGTVVGYKRYHFDTKTICSGDVLVGIPSSGFHTNGFSLLRKYYDDSLIPGIKNPHRCYSELIYSLINTNSNENSNKYIKGLSHITGGGFYDNLNRVIKVPYELYDFEFPLYYKSLLEKMTRKECINTFNCGYGLVIICSKELFNVILDIEKDAKVIGKVI